MIMQVITSGLGVSIKALNFGINGFSGAYLNFKNDLGSDIVYTIAIANSLSIGGKSGSIIYGQVATEFFPVLTERHPWAENSSSLKSLIGKNLELTVGGILVGDGNITVKLTEVDKNYNTHTLVSKSGVPAEGGQIATTMANGLAKELPRSVNSPKEITEE